LGVTPQERRHMRKSLDKVVLAVVIAGLLVGGIAIASAATKVRTVTTPQGTSVDVISVTGTVTEVSTAGTTENDTGVMGMLRRRPEGYAKVRDGADGTVYTLELDREEGAGIVMKVGDTVTVEGTLETRNSVNELNIWTFTGADGKTVTLRNADGSPSIETVSVAGTVIEVNLETTSEAPAPGGTTRPARKAMATIRVRQADDTIMTVVLGHEASNITVRIGDTVKIEGFKTPVDANIVMATTFTGADGKTVILRGLDGVSGPRGIRGESFTFSGIVTEVTPGATTGSIGDATEPIPSPVLTIKVKQADGTVLTVLLRDDESSLTVKVGDAVTVQGFKTPVDTNTVMATSFTGADGTTVRLGGRGLGRCGMLPGNRGAGRGFRGGMMGPGSAWDSVTPSET
jgi:hypothetical protein